MNLFVVILSHEHGDDIAIRSNEIAAYKAAGQFMLDTLGELEEAVEDDEEGTAKLERLKNKLQTGFEKVKTVSHFKESMVLYNEMFVDYMESSENHEIRIKSAELDAGV